MPPARALLCACCPSARSRSPRPSGAPDEDVLTVSWHAAARALAAGGVERTDVDGLWWGTSRPPFAEGPSLSMLAAALGLRDDIAGALNSGSTLAGIDALLSAWDAVAAAYSP